jgi:tetratricopeptide (TPR) repeat protein
MKIVEKKQSLKTLVDFLFFSTLIASMSALLALNFWLTISVSLNDKKDAGQIVGVSKIDSWKDFLEKNPTYFPGWIQLANLYINSGMKDQALEAYQQAKKINPNAEDLVLLKIKINQQFPPESIN